MMSKQSSLLLHPCIPEEQLGFVLIVRAAPQLDIVCTVLGIDRVGQLVMKLDERPGATSSTLTIGESATTLVTLINTSANRCWNMTRLWVGLFGRARTFGDSRLVAERLIEQLFQRSLYNERHVGELHVPINPEACEESQSLLG
jgi:hypothetical protein